MKHNEAVAYAYNEEKPVIQDMNSQGIQTTLPMEELLGLFAHEISEIVDYDSFEYENAENGIHLFHGSPKLHKCRYKIKESGMELGQITLTRQRPFKEEEMLVVERALGALSIHLNNAIDHQCELEQEQRNALKRES